MVQQGDMEISLVQADTKEPFKEHTKDGKVYVEVEPDAEYFIGMRRIGNTNAHNGTLLIVASVDGKGLGYHMHFGPTITSNENVYHAGLWTLKGDVSTQTALKFTKPKYSAQEGGGGSQQSSRVLMGKVEVEVYDAVFAGYSERSNYQTSWEASTIDQAVTGRLAEKKSLRSGQGLETCSKQVSGQSPTYTKGALVDVITLNYCAAVGLIQVGVLPKPPLWVYHRMLFPAKKPSATDESSSTTGVGAAIPGPTKIIRSDENNNSNQENDLLDLSNTGGASDGE